MNLLCISWKGKGTMPDTRRLVLTLRVTRKTPPGIGLSPPRGYVYSILQPFRLALVASGTATLSLD